MTLVTTQDRCDEALFGVIPPEWVLIPNSNGSWHRRLWLSTSASPAAACWSWRTPRAASPAIRCPAEVGTNAGHTAS